MLQHGGLDPGLILDIAKHARGAIQRLHPLERQINTHGSAELGKPDMKARPHSRGLCLQA
jgi:hypothetical protein